MTYRVVDVSKIMATPTWVRRQARSYGMIIFNDFNSIDFKYRKSKSESI